MIIYIYIYDNLYIYYDYLHYLIVRYTCHQVSPVMPMSSDCWAMSFAKYLELRFHGDDFTRRPVMVRPL